uniref:AC9 transposase n=1 Tax=Cajanus cajan TaxID=3821 RepID=A0A151TP81_CAJCA|nr:Putative AC9 transposase [Cajanus cajan]
MFIAMELLFRNIKREAVREFLSIIAPSLTVYSRTTLARHILKIWDNEKAKLKKFLSRHCHRVCLTTHMWTCLVLHPRYKLKFMHWLINQRFDGVVASNLKDKVESSIRLLFEEYNCGRIEFEANSQEARLNEEASDDPYGYNQFFKSTGSHKYELSKYLEEALKLNSGRFPILSNMARDLLVIPISTMASESAFSIGGRVLDAYRSSLTPQMVEALFCMQDWLKWTLPPLSLNEIEDFVEFEKFEQGNNFF